jgi:hypothetical protein
MGEVPIEELKRRELGEAGNRPYKKYSFTSMEVRVRGTI